MPFQALAAALPAVAEATSKATSAVPMALQSRNQSDPYTSIPINVGPFGDFNTAPLAGSGGNITMLAIGLAAGGLLVWLLR
ncbi:hypothetical protein [Pyruvatibacter mobilis]|jgi:hypothetical protein|uniref:hypothetical protein n=1 Tax=Pyruvatibacter mobilis TaxID=1712261 RepID=UPI003D100E93